MDIDIRVHKYSALYKTLYKAGEMKPLIVGQVEPGSGAPLSIRLIKLRPIKLSPVPFSSSSSSSSSSSPSPPSPPSSSSSSELVKNDGKVSTTRLIKVTIPTDPTPECFH